MATYPETKIIEGLLNHLSTLVLSPVIQIAWPNVDFDPPPEGYLRASHIPVSTRAAALGNSAMNRHEGLLQIDVMWPLQAGEIAPKEIAGAVADHFKRGTVLTSDGLVIRINKPPVIAGAIKSEPYLQIPVSVGYTADASNSI